MKKLILSTLSIAVLGLGFTSIAEEEKTAEEAKQKTTSIREIAKEMGQDSASTSKREYRYEQSNAHALIKDNLKHCSKHCNKHKQNQ
jgi:hypothetical protein